MSYSHISLKVFYIFFGLIWIVTQLQGGKSPESSTRR